MSPLAKLPDALKRYERAKDALRAAVEKAYPIGAVVGATLGRAYIRGEVVCHCWDVGYIVVRNEKTGKDRKFYAASRSLHDVEVLSYPKEADRG